jgi:hypothetical protein
MNGARTNAAITFPESQDPTLQQLVAEASADPNTVGLILSGSRGAGCADHESDYDVEHVLADAVYTERQAGGELAQVKKSAPGGGLLDLGYTCPAELSRIAAEPGWWTAGYATARAILDKTGEVTAALERIATMPEEKAKVDAGGWFDAYLNAFYRSLKAWRRADELGGRLQAAESAMHLVRTLFSLARRWPPYHDRLRSQLARLEEQGWSPSYLEEALLGLVTTGDPRLQQELEERVEALMRDHGYGGVVDAWGGEIERVRAFAFG